MRDHRHTSAYLFGAVCPARGVGAAVIMPDANIAAMNAHLAEISPALRWAPRRSDPRRGWLAQRGRLCSSGQHRTAAAAALYSRANPVENIWEFLRGNILSHQFGTPTRPSSMPAAAPGTHSWPCVMCFDQSHIANMQRSEFRANGIRSRGCLRRTRSISAPWDVRQDRSHDAFCDTILQPQQIIGLAVVGVPQNMKIGRRGQAGAL